MTRKEIEDAVKAFNSGKTIRLKGYRSSSGAEHDYEIRRQPPGYYMGLVRVSLAEMEAPNAKDGILHGVRQRLPSEDVADERFLEEYDAAFDEILASLRKSLEAPAKQKSVIVENDDGLLVDPREDQDSEFAAIYVRPIVEKAERTREPEKPKKSAARLKTRIKDAIRDQLPTSEYVPMLKLSANRLKGIETI